ncbi:YkvA family protein [Psychroflexus aestuariivivens]|uniref:YkvA family protein n=1 Tax=Psychroflexus aestuariivivens TaxID=1795040 RepID=UPI001F026AB3|nr:YkvA family protein [Psychroflexus aestuariivivens]
MKKVDQTYVEEQSSKISEEDHEQAINRKDELFAKINHPNWKKYREKIMLLFNMLKDIKQKHYSKTPWKTLASAIFAILYIINPLDIVPDFIPFIGYLDDITVLTFVLKMVGDDLTEYEAWKADQKEENHREIEI